MAGATQIVSASSSGAMDHACVCALAAQSRPDGSDPHSSDARRSCGTSSACRVVRECELGSRAVTGLAAWADDPHPWIEKVRSMDIVNPGPYPRQPWQLPPLTRVLEA